MPVRYEFKVRFNFVGNVVDGSYLASLDYSSIELKEKSKYRKEKKKLNLTESYTLRCDTNSLHLDSAYFASLRPIELMDDEKKLYEDYAFRKDTCLLYTSKEGNSFFHDTKCVLSYIIVIKKIIRFC